MGLKYCVFWIPTIYQHGIPIPLKDEVNGDISDNSDKNHIISIKLQANRDFVISNETSQSITLNFIDGSRNGLLLYSYDANMLADTTLGFIVDKMPNAVYHMIKEFYHVHEFHQSDTDSLLSAYESDSKVDIKQNNNPALNHYLELYQSKLKAYANQISQLSQQLNIITKKASQKYIALDAFKVVDDLCINAIGEGLYCNTLLSSKYTKCNRLNINSHNEQRLRILNINNSLKKIQVNKTKNSVEFNFRMTKLSFKNTSFSFLLAWSSIILAIISFVITFKGCGSSTIIQTDSQEVSSDIIVDVLYDRYLGGFGINN